MEFTVVKILLEETLELSDSPLQSKKGDVSNSVSPKGEDRSGSRAYSWQKRQCLQERGRKSGWLERGDPERMHR